MGEEEEHCIHKENSQQEFGVGVLHLRNAKVPTYPKLVRSKYTHSEQDAMDPER